MDFWTDRQLNGCQLNERVAIIIHNKTLAIKTLLLYTVLFPLDKLNEIKKMHHQTPVSEEKTLFILLLEITTNTAILMILCSILHPFDGVDIVNLYTHTHVKFYILRKQIFMKICRHIFKRNIFCFTLF